MRILVTGGSGNVGRVVLRELGAAGHVVRSFDTTVSVSEGVDSVVGDIRDPEAVLDAVRGMDAIVHLAAIPAFKPGIPAHDFMEVNVVGTSNVLEAAAAEAVGKVVFAGSDSALGFVFATHPHAPDYLPIDEDHPLRPQDPYGLSKLLGEELCRAATRRHGMETVCLRFCWVWFEDTYANHAAITAMPMEELRKGLWGYVDVRDAARACRLAVERPVTPGSESLFITADDTYLERPSPELIAKAYPGVPLDESYFAAAPHRSLFNTARAARALGYAPRYHWREIV